MSLPGLRAVDHVGVTVPSLEEGVRFYCEVLGARFLYRLGPFDSRRMPASATGGDWSEAHVGVAGAAFSIAMLELAANLKLELFEFGAPESRRRAPGCVADAGPQHLALHVDDLEKAKEHLARNGCRILAGPLVLDGPCEGIRINYCQDPFGNAIELVESSRT